MPLTESSQVWHAQPVLSTTCRPRYAQTRSDPRAFSLEGRSIEHRSSASYGKPTPILRVLADPAIPPLTVRRRRGGRAVIPELQWFGNRRRRIGRKLQNVSRLHREG